MLYLSVFPETKTIPENLEESTDTLKLCPSEDFLKLRKEKAEEVWFSLLGTEKGEK